MRRAGSYDERWREFAETLGLGMTEPSMLTADDLLEMYNAGHRSFTRLELEVPEFGVSGACLDGADFSFCFIAGSFRKASLRNCSFQGSNLKTCDFSGADLTNADFTNTALDATIFLGAIMTGARFCGAGLQGYAMAEGEVPFW